MAKSRHAMTAVRDIRDGVFNIDVPFADCFNLVDLKERSEGNERHKDKRLSGWPNY
jgi:hypothetical protein